MNTDEGPRAPFSSPVFSAASLAADIRCRAVELSARLVGQVPPRATGESAAARADQVAAIFDDVRNAGQSIQRDLEAIDSALHRIEASL